jgi:regulation of enolase protein 1 (concanavalin A-like superfamily)
MKPVLLLFSIFGLTLFSKAQTDTSGFRIPGIPSRISWEANPQSWKYEKERLSILAGGKTDLFVDPRHEYQVVNSPKALFSPADTFVLSAKATVSFASDYDAGVLVLFANGQEWAKLCFEFSPQKIPNIVSVVNNGVSDDCNHEAIKTNQVYLRIAGLGSHTYAFFYSLDGKRWHLVRYFSINTSLDVRLGFSSQSPTGNSCETVFSDIRYQVRQLKEIRDEN